uniref:Ig-like domain-containing protein n=1 Tax=Tetranychus urticae TaxID=32264 RepID=T1JZ19_TETUR
MMDYYLCVFIAIGFFHVSSTTELHVLADHRITLVCNISFPLNDHILLILWYKGDINGSPVYTIDGRYKNRIEEAEHFKSSELGERAHVDIKSFPITLTINPVLTSDEAIYFCRVDFKWARTLSTSIKLNVQVPPSKLVITNVNGIPFRKFAGPFNQGETALIKCIALGGKPLPSLIWYQNENIIDDSYNQSAELNQVENVLIVKDLQRIHLFQELKCLSHHEAYGSSSATVTLEINLKPLSVEISTSQSTHKAGLKSTFTCTTHGSRPPAIISWYINNRTLPYSRESYSDDGNYSSSILELTNSRSLDGSVLICRAVNKRLAGSTLQDELKLDIKYSPVCKDNQRVNYPASIGELVDITCEVIANPNKVTFTWTKKHNETNYSNLQSNSLSFLSEPMTATWPTSMATSTSRPISTNIIKSVLKVNVESTSDFAVYTCLAENVIGGNLEPCSFTIEPQDPPAKPKYCSIMEREEHLSIDCIPDQVSSPVDYYILEAYSDENDNNNGGQLLLDKVNETVLPVFQLTNLESNGSYILVTYAVNKIGKSSELIIPLRKAKSTSSHLHVPSVKETEIITVKDPISPMFGTLSILLMLVSSVILSILCLLIILIRCKLNKKNDKQKQLSWLPYKVENAIVLFYLEIRSLLLKAHKGIVNIIINFDFSTNQKFTSVVSYTISAYH